MKHDEKARELVDKYDSIITCGEPSNRVDVRTHERNQAKQCALITVDEIMYFAPLTNYPNEYIAKHGTPIGSKNWWKEVRKAIEQLKN